MRYREFPKDSQRVSALGMGCMRLPTKDGAIDRPEAVSLIRRAIEGGVNYVDTAYGYHGGESERLVGEALEGGYRERVLLATKLPSGWSRSRRTWKGSLPRAAAKSCARTMWTVYLLHALDAARFENIVKAGGLDFMRRLPRRGPRPPHRFFFPRRSGRVPPHTRRLRLGRLPGADEPCSTNAIRRRWTACAWPLRRGSASSSWSPCAAAR